MLKSQLPNLFDQYDLYENRVTNALLQTLSASNKLAVSFLRKFLNAKYIARRDRLVIVSQKRPAGAGDLPAGSNKGKKNRRTIPDGLIICEGRNWAVVLESKVLPRQTRLQQLYGHLKQIKGYSDRKLLLITPDREPPNFLQKREAKAIKWDSWLSVHQWVSRELTSASKDNLEKLFLRNLKGYLEMNESLVVFKESTLMMATTK